METGTISSSHTLSLCEALSLERTGEIISVVGGGGKSALLFRLGRELPGRTVLTTTTRIFAAQTARVQRSCCFGTPEFRAAIDSPGGLLVIGAVEGDKAKGVPVEVPAELLAAAEVDFVVVEADGSRMLPAKAPAEHEPVLPEETTLLVVAAGIDALAGPIAKTCHRPERVAKLLGVDPKDPLDPAGLAKLLGHAQGGLKSVPRDARVVLLVNKVESEVEWDAARALAVEACRNPRVDRVVLGALEPAGDASTIHDPGFEIWQRD
jgi:molybdenum cofactor cytidylyltransferase